MAVGWIWPKLNLALLVGQCLDRRIGDKGLLISEVEAWEKERNETMVKSIGVSRPKKLA